MRVVPISVRSLQEVSDCSLRGAQGLLGYAALFLIFSTAAQAQVPVESGGIPDAIWQTMQPDAELTDVTFVDDRHGWAAGDRGTILHTKDGGESWQLQSVPVRCRLESVCFLNQEQGWAAGGIYHPYLQSTSGVLLYTTDGGQNWQWAKRLALPYLRQVRFVDEKHGWLITDRAPTSPSGVLITQSGEGSWAKLTPDGNLQAELAATQWLAGDFLKGTNGTLVGEPGSIGVVRNRSIEPSSTPNLGLRAIKAIRLDENGGGMLAGDGGLVLFTADFGKSWQLPETTPVNQGVDWKGLFHSETESWLVGNPGSVICSTNDHGKSWQTHETGISTPLNAICFADDLHGFAVGALGTIVGTNDGGKSWAPVRRGGTRSALLGVFADEQSIPVEILTSLCGDEGYLGAVQVVCRQDGTRDAVRRVLATSRLQAAVSSSGGDWGEISWLFPAPPPDWGVNAKLTEESWNRNSDGRAMDWLKEELVKRIRTWRPEVLLTHASFANSHHPFALEIGAIATEAAHSAEDPTSFPEQISELGLRTWSVRRIVGVMPTGQSGEAEFELSRTTPRLGETVRVASSGSRGILDGKYEVVPDVIGLQIISDQGDQRAWRGEIFSGIVSYPGGECRRKLFDVPEEHVAQALVAAQRHRNLRSILDGKDPLGDGRVDMTPQVMTVSKSLSPAAGGDLLFQLGKRLQRGGRGTDAAAVFSEVLQRNPTGPLANLATQELLQHWSSAEIAHCERQRASGMAGLRTGGDGNTAPEPVTLASGAAKTGRSVENPAAVRIGTEGGIAIELANRDEGLQRALDLANNIEQGDSSLRQQPAVEFVIAAARREAGFDREAERFYLEAAQSSTGDPWSLCALGERWLADPQKEPPKPVIRTYLSASPPHLDGILDDECWQTCEAVPITRSPESQDPDATVLLTYDNGYLYLAAVCRGGMVNPSEESRGPRPRDPQLANHDRLQIFLDVDRDYATSYCLTIDDRGWCSENCGENVTWNPRWFVASARQKEEWTIEVAIPFSEMVSSVPSPRSVWNIGLQRINPSKGFSAASWPADPRGRPEGFSYLIFQ